MYKQIKEKSDNSKSVPKNNIWTGKREFLWPIENGIRKTRNQFVNISNAGIIATLANFAVVAARQYNSQ